MITLEQLNVSLRILSDLIYFNFLCGADQEEVERRDLSGAEGLAALEEIGELHQYLGELTGKIAEQVKKNAAEWERE